jgi:uncharacterized protein (TIGR01370 family)
MFNFIGEIGDYARRTSPNANTQYLIVAQNAPDLYDEDPERYVDLVDAIAEEAIWYEGYADADWNDSRGYNYKTRNWYKYVLETLPEIKKRMPVFCVEYAQDEDGKKYASHVYKNKAPKYGFIPYCTRRSLSHLSKTPYPRGYKPKDY